MHQIAGVAGSTRAEELSRWLPPPEAVRRRAAVLMLFGAGTDGTGDVLMLERAATMRSHAGQVAFPGGAVDPTDAGPEAAALREAHEETGLDPAGVDVVGVLPELFLPPSGFSVTPVVAWWREPSPIHAEAVEEVAAVLRVPLPELLDPANRFSTRVLWGHRGPAFQAGGLFVWGFTAGLLSRVLSLAGLERPWSAHLERPVPESQLTGPLPGSQLPGSAPGAGSHPGPGQAAPSHGRVDTSVRP